MNENKPPLTKGKKGSFIQPSGKKFHFKVIDEVSITTDYSNGNNRDKYHKLIQVIQFEEDGSFAFRLCYYHYNPEKDNWVWGQFTQIIGATEWNKLFQMAKEKGFFENYKNPDNSY